MKANNEIFVLVLASLMTIQSCMVYKPLREPYSKSIPEKLKPGNVIKLTLANGSNIGKIKVTQVWADSLLVGSGSKAISISEVGKISKRQFSPGLTILAIVVPFGIIVAIIGPSVSQGVKLSFFK